MPVTRRMVAQNQEENQVLKMDSAVRYLVNDEADEWQYMFGPNSEPVASTQVAKIGAQFDPVNLDSIHFTGYLYNTVTGAIDNAATCEFKFYKVINPNWSDSYLFSEFGAQLPNQYYYLSKGLDDFPTVDFDGGDSIAVEVVITRLTSTYRDKLYFNHLGIYGSLIQLRNFANFLDITKKDL